MRETEILVEQQPPQGVLVCDHAGLVINKFSSYGEPSFTQADLDAEEEEAQVNNEEEQDGSHAQSSHGLSPES